MSATAESSAGGAFQLYVYDRETPALNQRSVDPVDDCAGPIIVLDNPDAPLEAQPFLCSADGLHQSMDLFSGHPNAG